MRSAGLPSGGGAAFASRSIALPCPPTGSSTPRSKTTASCISSAGATCLPFQSERARAWLATLASGMRFEASVRICRRAAAYSL